MIYDLLSLRVVQCYIWFHRKKHDLANVAGLTHTGLEGVHTYASGYCEEVDVLNFMVVVDD